MTPQEKAAEAGRLFHIELEERAERRIREIVREEIARTRTADVPLRHVVQNQMRLQGFGENGPALNVLCDVLHANLFEGDLAASRASDTLPCPPPGDSHSGAIVVPRGSSRPPAMRRDDVCDTCGMICCVCPHCFGYPTDGGDGEGGP